MAWTEGDLRELTAILRDAYGEDTQVWPEDPVDVLILTLLSQATSDQNRDRAFRRLKERFPTWAQVEAAPLEEVIEAIALGGLAQQKAPRIKAILQRLREEWGTYTIDHVASLDEEEAFAYLESLPGIGPKTAACVLLFAFDRPAFPVDTHVRRVGERLGLFPRGTDAIKAQRYLQQVVPPEIMHPLHVLLIAHGRRYCRARRPLCTDCFLLPRCVWGNRQGGDEPS
ncbi:MAG: endonuclease III domain-containing protein [Limnochordia bacterium]